MRILADQDVYAVTVALLRANRDDVVTASELGLSRASDVDLLKAAAGDNRILLTRDRDYGALVYVQSLSGGIIYLRLTPPTMAAVHAELLRVLGTYEQDVLSRSFVVVERARHRIRTISP